MDSFFDSEDTVYFHFDGKRRIQLGVLTNGQNDEVFTTLTIGMSKEDFLDLILKAK